MFIAMNEHLRWRVFATRFMKFVKKVGEKFAD